MGKSGERGREGEPGIKVPVWLHFLFVTDLNMLNIQYLSNYTYDYRLLKTPFMT